jgi:zinc protease
MEASKTNRPLRSTWKPMMIAVSGVFCLLAPILTAARQLGPLGTTALHSIIKSKSLPPQTASKPADQAAAAVNVDAILDKYIAALGGKDAIKNVTSVLQIGTFEAPEAGLKGSAEGYSKLPNKFLQKINIEGIGVFVRGYDGKIGWFDDPTMGTGEITGQELAQTLSLSDLHRDIKYRQLYKALTFSGKEKVGDSEAYVIEAVPPQGKPEKLYFDISTGLLVRQDIVVISPTGETSTQTFYEDYRDVGGVRMPFTVRQVSPALSFVTRLSDIKVNVPIDDAKFAKPSRN